MAKFHDVLAALQGIEGDYPGDMFDQLSSAYDEDMAVAGQEIQDAAAAKIATLTNEAAEMSKALEKTKAHNYDLLMSDPAPSDSGDEDGEDEDETPAEDEGVDSLFEDDEEGDK